MWLKPREVRSSSGHTPIHDSSSLLPSIWKRVIHFIRSPFPRWLFNCSSWTSWTCREKLSEFFHKMWSQCSLEVLYSSSVWLSQIISVKQSLENRGLAFKAISRSGSPFFRFQFCCVTPVIKCIFKYKPWRLTVKPRWDFRRRLCCHHQLASMRLHPLSHCIWLIVIIGLIFIKIHGANSSATIEKWHLSPKWRTRFDPSEGLRNAIPFLVFRLCDTILCGIWHDFFLRVRPVAPSQYLRGLTIAPFNRTW